MDYFEIDFIHIDADKSGEAIALRYEIDGATYIHVVDGGFQDSGQLVVDHINQYYGRNSIIDHVVATHPDGDHLGGLRTILEDMNVLNLWMLRPWNYVTELIPYFANINSEPYLTQLLRTEYPNVVALEEIANRRGIPIHEPFQGAQIGAFIVMSPRRDQYLQLIADSERTPEARSISGFGAPLGILQQALKAAVQLKRALWGEENFSEESTSRENEMSVVQAALLCEQKILLTADTGREGLENVVNYAPRIGLNLPGIDRFQVPHHGSRRNMSTDLLDSILGQRHQGPGNTNFTAAICASDKDPDHPRKAAIRGMIHRGGRVITTEKATFSVGKNAPEREGWVPATAVPYPDEQE